MTVSNSHTKGRLGWCCMGTEVHHNLRSWNAGVAAADHLSLRLLAWK